MELEIRIRNRGHPTTEYTPFGWAIISGFILFFLINSILIWRKS